MRLSTEFHAVLTRSGSETRYPFAIGKPQLTISTMHLVARLLPTLAFLLMTLTHVSNAQSDPDWRVFSSLEETNDVSPTERGGVLVATDGGAYHVTAEGEIADIWRSNGELLELRVTALGEDPFTGDLYFGSDNGAVSILRQAGWWTYVGELSRSGKPDREITGFHFGEDFVYILSSFGVSLYSRPDSTLRDSWTRLGPIQADTRVNDMALIGDSIFLATEGGLAIAPASGRDLADPLNWRVALSPEPCGPPVRSLGVVDGTLLLAGPGGLCRYVEGELQHIPGTPEGMRISRSDKSPLLGAAGERIYSISEGGDISEIGQAPGSVSAIGHAGDAVIAAGLSGGGVALIGSQGVNVIVPDGPVSNSFVDLVVDERGGVWAASGDRGVSRLFDSTWHRYRGGEYPGLSSSAIRNVSIDHTGRVWGGSFGDGFFRFTINEDAAIVETFDETNTPLQDVNGSPGFTVAENVVSDESGVVWALNWDNTDGRRNALYSYRYGDGESDGTWMAHPFSGRFFSYTKTFRWIVVDFNGTKWIGGVDKPQGLLYYVDGEDGMAGEWNSLTESNGLPSNAQTSLLVDEDGELWVGTPSGATILVNPWGVRQDGPAAAIFRDVPALSDVYISDIAADVLNRKWVGTEQGVFLMSPDGTELLAHYTTSNSPLTNNGVLSVAIDEANGYVYLGTRNGLNRLETPAVRPTESERISVQPQPFIQGVDTELRFSGLPPEATLKILTVDGRLVAEFPSPGGAVGFWDGRDSDGEMVSTGIYLVLAESRDGVSVAGKCAIVRE